MCCAKVLASQEVFPRQKQHMQIIMHVAAGGKPVRKDYKKLVQSEADELWPILEKCWTDEPSDRPNMDDMLKMLVGVRLN